MTYFDQAERFDQADRADPAGRAALERAEAGVTRMVARRGDRWYPRAHIAAPAGWINDPNGLVFFDGRYHVFFQHNPYGVDWGHMHWGHVSSADLVTWHREPIAMAPELEAEAGGVFSGSAVVAPDAAGRPTMAVFYTGHGRPGSAAGGTDQNGGGQDGGGQDGGAARQVQCLATTADGRTFTKHGVIIKGPRVMSDFRDPKVWRSGDRWYMVVGASTADRHAEVWLYSCSAQTVEGFGEWRFEQVLHRDAEPGVYMAECPDFFPLTAPDGRLRWVLAYCAMSTRHVSVARYVVGAWAPGRPFEAGPARRCDDGPSYYAPQTMETPDGRRVALAWMPGPGGPSVPPSQAAGTDGWCGQLTVPRRLTLGDDDTLQAVPVSELERLRVGTRDLGGLTLEPGRRMHLDDDLPVGEIEMEIDAVPGVPGGLRLVVDATPDGASVGIDIDLAGRRANLVGRDAGSQQAADGTQQAVDGSQQAAGQAERGPAPRRADVGTATRLEVRVLLDRGSVEVFCDGGRQTVSATTYPAAGPRGVEIEARGATVTVTSLRIHRIGPIFR